MTSAPIEEALSFDVSGALAAIQTVDDALTQVVQTFSVGLAQALESLTGAGANVTPLAETLDVQGLAPAIDTALQSANAVVPIEADTTAAADQIDQLVLGLTETVPIEADTSAAADEIGQLTLGLTEMVPVDADTTAAQDAISGLIAQPIEEVVTADTSEAQQAIDDLTTSASSASGSVDSLSGGVDALSASTGIAKGQVGELGGFISNISPASAEAATGVVALGGFIAAAGTAAADAQAQNKRFADTFGVLADQVNRINVGGLVTNIKDLGTASGTSNADLEATASRIGQLGKTSGAAGGNIVGTTQNLLALGATIAVNNPRLGDAATVTDRLGAALARGGRALVPFGIGLTSAQINFEAFKETGKTSAAELTTFEKITAGANLAVKAFGGSLGTEFAAGAANAQIQLQSLKVQLEETLVAVGGPLLTPLISSLKELTPVAQETGVVLGNLGGIVLPVLGTAAQAIGLVAAPLGLVADGLHALGTAGPFAAIGMAALGAVLFTDTATLYAYLSAEALVAEATVLLGNPFVIAAAAIAGLGLVAGTFDERAHAVAAATKDWTDALFGAASGAQTLDAQVAQLDTNIDKQVTKFIEAQKTGSAFRDALDGAGGGANGLSAALNGNADTFNAYVNSVQNATVNGLSKFEQASDAGKVASINAKNALEIQRAALQNTVEGQIANLRTTNALTDAQLKNIDSTFHLNTATADYVGALKEANAEADRNIATQQKTADANVAQSGAIKDVADSVRGGTVALADAKTVSDQYGISIGKATQLITDSEQAQDRHAASTIGDTRAFRLLVENIARGNVSIPAASAALQGMGFSLDGAATAAQGLTQQLQQFVSQGLSALPAAGAAIDSFTSGITSAQSALESALSKSATAGGSSATAISKAQDSANQAIATSATSQAQKIRDAERKIREAQAGVDQAVAGTSDAQAQKIRDAEQKIRDAQAGVDRAWQDTSTHQAQTVRTAEGVLQRAQDSLANAQRQGGTVQASAIRTAQNALQRAQDGLIRAQEQAGTNQANAVTGANQKVEAARNSANQTTRDAASAAEKAQQAYIDAINPQKVVDATNAQTFAILKFQTDIDTLIRRGRTSLAAQLITTGPDKGAKAAEAFVSNDAIAAGEERGLRLGAKVREGYKADLINHAGELANVSVTLANGLVVPFRNAGVAGGHALASGITSGFSTGLNVSTDQAQRKNSVTDIVKEAIANEKAVKDATTAGAAAATAAQTGFTDNFHPDTAAKSGVAKIPAAITAASGPAKTTATTTAEGLTTAFASGLDFETVVQGALRRVPAALILGVAGLARIASAEGRAVGAAFGEGFAGGLTVSNHDVSAAAGALATTADEAIRRRLGIKSPSSVGQDIGVQFVAGIAQGLAELSPVHQATAALKLALVPNIKDLAQQTVRQVPALAPGIAAAAATPLAVQQQLAAAAAGVGRGAQANVRVDLHKVDVNPRHLADEISWRLGR